jgi:DNA polymerase-3 subunit alpha
MAANLTNSINNISDITKFMDECKKMGISVLGPDINESDRTFTVNKKGNIRFGMAGIKGVGNAIVDNIVEGRQDEPYKNIFDFVERMSKAGNSINRNVMESLAYAGAFDSFSEIRREQFFSANSKGEIFIEALCTYGSRIQNDTLSQGNTLFGEEDEAFKPVPPEIPAPQEYNVLEFLNKEKELIGMYLSAHPLDTYKFEVNNFAQMTVSQVQEEIKIASETPGFKSKEIYIAGLVSSVSKKVSQKSGKPWMKFGIEDYTSTLYFSLFGKDYETFMSFVEAGQALFLKVCIQPRYFGKPASGNEKKEAKECECRVRRMTLLANTKDDFIRSFTISLPAGRINGDIRRNLTSLLKKNKGNHTLEIRLTDHEKRIAVEFQSMKYRIDVNNDLLEYLNDNDIKYTVDTRISL